jgi:hypothetical protein
LSCLVTAAELLLSRTDIWRMGVIAY